MEAGLPSENSAKTEFELLQFLLETKIPSAVPIYLDNDGDILDKPFFITSYIGGTQNFNDLEESYINSMANQLRDIHEVNINNLPNLPLRIDPLDGLLNNLPKKYKWKELRDYIKQLSIEKYIADSVLLHGDFWKGNLLWKSSNINGVVDWDYAAQGDPLSDLAVACLMIRYLNGQQDMDSFMAAYKQNSEIDEKRFLLWLINVASSTLYFINEWRFTTEDKNKMIDTATTIIFESYNQIKIIN